MGMNAIYLDHNATTPLHPEVLEAMLPFLGERFGNPSSLHTIGQAARRAVDRAREAAAGLLGAEPAEIVFEGSGTEANNHALKGLAAGGGHLLTSAVEHEAVGHTCRVLGKQGCQVTYLPVDARGRVDPERVVAALRDDTVLVSVMLANNEVGTIQPVKEIAARVRDRGIVMHTDAVQAVGKIPVDVNDLGVDLLTFSGHKIYGPKGVGGLYIRRGVKIPALVHGGHHEKNRRAGTENVPALVGLGKACELAGANLGEESNRLAGLRDRLQRGVLERISGARLNSAAEERLPNTLNLCFPDLDGSLLLMNLDLLGVALSTGSACTSGHDQPSHVLAAMGLNPEEIRGSVRLSLGRGNTEEEIDRAIEAMVQAVAQLRENYPG